MGCETVKADQAGSTSSVALAWDAKSGKSAKFDGNGVLVVPFMANFFADRNIQAFTVALWFKWTGDISKIGGLVNNGNCETDPSFDVHVGTGQDVSGTFSTAAVSGESTGDYGVSTILRFFVEQHFSKPPFAGQIHHGTNISKLNNPNGYTCSSKWIFQQSAFTFHLITGGKVGLESCSRGLRW